MLLRGAYAHNREIELSQSAYGEHGVFPPTLPNHPIIVSELP